MKLTLPYPIYCNDQYIHLKSGRVILAPEVRGFRERAGWEAKKQMLEQGVYMLKGDVTAVIHLYRPKPNGDTDGPVKQLFDALQGIVYENDSQIVHYEVTRHDDAKAPRVEMVVDKVG